MKQKLLCFLVLGLLLIGSAYAQDRRISGRVTSAGDPVAGVTVSAVGASVATQTDADGTYSISVPTSVQSLEFRSLGFTTRVVAISGNTLNVSLEADAMALSEVVVTGYGSQRRVEVTGSIGTIKGEVFKDVAAPSFDKFLQGQVAGVQATNTSGMLGQPARIRIRGTNSISSSSDPLYVVDGMPYVSGAMGGNTTSNPLGDINPNDIANVEVLKDGAATAIYGSRAANGVILITTKRGQAGAPKLTYDNWFAIANPSRKFDLLNGAEFMEIANEKLVNVNRPAAAFPMTNPATNQPYDTDWQSEILKQAFQHNHALSFSGATEKTNYFFSVGFADMEGIIDANTQRRYNFRAKLDQKAFNDRVTFGLNTAITHTTNTGLNTGSNALSGNFGAIIALPNVPVMMPDGDYNLSADEASLGRGNNELPMHANYTNQRFVLDNNIYKNMALNLTGNAFVDFEILSGLNFRTAIGITSINIEDFHFRHPRHGDGRGSNGGVYQYFLPTFRYNWQNTLNYNLAIGEHKINAVIGQEYQKTSNRNFTASGTNLSSIYFGENGNLISGSLTNQFVGGGASERAFESVFGRINYSLFDRYLLSATLRHDKISSLPHGNQGATLPGGSIGWRISEESFFDVSWMNEFKVRGGYAKVGNTEIGNYPYAGVFAATQYGDWSGIRFNQAGNGDLSFETSNKINVGVDLGFLNNRITFIADYFKNDIDNLILAVPTPPSLGIPGNSINQNVGQMFNKGWEFTVNAGVIEKENFSWSTSLNASFIKNEVVTLVGGNDMVYTYHINREGLPIGSFFGYQSHGVNPANGNPIFEKADGSLIQQRVGATTYAVYDPANPADVSTNAAALTQADKRILGEANPTWYGGFNNTFVYKDFDLNLFMTFSGGNMVYNQTAQETLYNMNFANNGKGILNRWTTPGQVTDVPKLAYGMAAQVNQEGHLNSRFLEKGDFLRVQNIALGYTLPSNFLTRINANTMRLYVQLQNAFIFTNYSGVDPEVSSSVTTNSQPSLDNRTNPVPKTFTFGLNIGF